MTDEQIDEDTIAAAKSYLEELVTTSLRVARVDEYVVVSTKQILRETVERNMRGPEQLVHLFEKFCVDASPVEGTSLLSLADNRWTDEYKSPPRSYSVCSTFIANL